MADRHHDIERFLSFGQLESKKHLDALWSAVETAKKAKFGNKPAEDLPYDISQKYFALLNRLDATITEMASIGNSLPQQSVVDEIRNRTIKLIQEIDEYKEA